MSELHIEDQSGDKNYFTIIPNFVLDNSTAQEAAVYAHFKRFAGVDNIAFPSKQTLMKKLCLSKPTLSKIIGTLQDKGWIQFKGEREVKTNGGIQKVHQYSIVDIWGINREKYEKAKGVKSSTTSKGVKNTTQRGVKIDSKGVKNRPTKYNHLSRTIEEDVVADKPATVAPPKMQDTDPMTLSQFMEWCKKSPLRHINIIAEYADEKKIDFTTVGQWREFIRRNVRPAKTLSPYSDDQIEKAMLKIEKSQYITRWTLETLTKYLD